MSIELLMPSNHLILYRPLFLLPSIFSSIRVSLAASIITCSSVNCIYHVLPFDHLHPIPPALVTTNLISFSMCVYVCVWSIIDLKHHFSSCYTTEWFHISTYFKIITTLFTNTVQRYYVMIDFIPRIVHFIPVTHLFCNLKFLLLKFPHLFLFSLIPLIPSHLAATCLFSVSVTLFCFVLFVHLFWFLDITYKWNHAVFVFLWLISCSIIPSRIIHVVAYDRISVFCDLIFCCIYVSTHVCIFFWAFILFLHLEHIPLSPYFA